MTDKQRDNLEEMKGLPAVMSDVPSRLPQLQVGDYKDELAELEISGEQAQELLQALWNIMSAFVDLGWGVDGVQLLFPELLNDVAQDSTKLIDSKDQDKGESE